MAAYSITAPHQMDMVRAPVNAAPSVASAAQALHCQRTLTFNCQPTRRSPAQLHAARRPRTRTRARTYVLLQPQARPRGQVLVLVQAHEHAPLVRGPDPWVAARARARLHVPLARSVCDAAVRRFGPWAVTLGLLPAAAAHQQQRRQHA